MPVSNDNQDYGESDKKNKSNVTSEKASSSAKSDISGSSDKEGTMTSDNLKGKKVDADLEQEKDKPADV
jgi:hypothetical protein